MVLIPLCERNMPLLQSIQAEYGTQPAFRLPDIGGLYWGIKQPGCETDHSTPISAEVKEEDGGGFSSTCTVAFVECTEITFSFSYFTHNLQVFLNFSDTSFFFFLSSHLLLPLIFFPWQFSLSFHSYSSSYFSFHSFLRFFNVVTRMVVRSGSEVSHVHTQNIKIDLNTEAVRHQAVRFAHLEANS